jgi:hypothetical protein
MVDEVLVPVRVRNFRGILLTNIEGHFGFQTQNIVSCHIHRSCDGSNDLIRTYIVGH